MICEDKNKLLISVLNNKPPVLVLGAGFSTGALNGQGEGIPKGEELANKLYTELIHLHKFDNDYSEELKKNKCDLKKVCDAWRDAQLLNQRNEFLTRIMKGCSCDEKSFHFLIRGYSWKQIYTLNIDDLIEYIYPKEELKNYYTKLHGSVLCPKAGYVFDSTEYLDFMAAEYWPLLKFGCDWSNNDVILLGTEFQEDDLKLIIQRLQKSGAETVDNNYFFVTPDIKSHSLRLLIENTHNYHHIPMTTETFLKFVAEKIQRVGDERERMKEQGMLFPDETIKKTNNNYYHIAHLYNGDIPRYCDFDDNWDIKYPYPNRIDTSKSTMITVHGRSYVGKTCVAMRILVDLMKKDFHVFQFNMSLSHDATRYIRIIQEHLNYLPENSCVAMLSENCSNLYEEFIKFLKALPSNISRMIIITTSDTNIHMSKKYLFKNDTNLIYELHVSETITRQYAENIYEKLKEKNHLKNLRYYGGNKREIKKYIL